MTEEQNMLSLADSTTQNDLDDILFICTSISYCLTSSAVMKDEKDLKCYKVHKLAKYCHFGSISLTLFVILILNFVHDYKSNLLYFPINIYQFFSFLETGSGKHKEINHI